MHNQKNYAKIQSCKVGAENANDYCPFINYFAVSRHKQIHKTNFGSLT